MRAIALLLVLAIPGPSVSTAICELMCANAAHHTSHAAAKGCHETEPADGGAALSRTAAAPCHGQQEESTAVVTPFQLLLPISSSIVEAVTTLDGDFRLTSCGRSAFRLSDRLPVRTPLRI